MAKEFLKDVKSQVWEALKKDLALPELENAQAQPITREWINYLLERAATLVVWNVYNLDRPGIKKLIDSPKLNKHFNLYDLGSCLIVVPKDLNDLKRTSADAVQAAQILAEEVRKREWVVEFGGFCVLMINAFWVRAQLLETKVLNYTPSDTVKRAYALEFEAKSKNPSLNPGGS